MGKFQKVGYDFLIVSNKAANDSQMSWKARGVYTHLVSKPDGWQFSIDRIAKNGNGGVDMVRSAIQELEKLGYLQRKRTKTGRVDYILFPEPQRQNPILAKAPLGKYHRGKTRGISKKDCISKKENTLCASYGSRTVKTHKPMKNLEPTIELDSLGDPLPPRESKTKTPTKLIQSVALHYATLFNVPKENLYFKYKRPIEEMITLAKEYHGENYAKIQAEIELRILVAKKYMEQKNWGKMKMSTIVESWNEIPEWKKQIK